EGARTARATLAHTNLVESGSHANCALGIVSQRVNGLSSHFDPSINLTSSDRVISSCKKTLRHCIVNCSGRKAKARSLSTSSVRCRYPPPQLILCLSDAIHSCCNSRSKAFKCCANAFG